VPDKHFMGLLGHSTCLFILPYSTGILGVTRAGGVLPQRPSQCCILYLKSVASDASWGKDPFWVVATGAQLRPEEDARGARRTNSEQRSALGVTESQQGYTKQLSFQGQSHSIKRSTKLILELVTGSEANRANRGRLQPYAPIVVQV